MSRLTVALGVVLLLLTVSGCTTFGVDPIRRAEADYFLAQVGAVYGVRPPVLVMQVNNAGIGARIVENVIYLSPAMLAWPYRNMLLAHALGHYLLNHRGEPAYENERAANIKAVEILTRVGPTSETTALRRFVDYQLHAVDGQGVPGHQTRCVEIADLVRAYPQSQVAVPACALTTQH